MSDVPGQGVNHQANGRGFAEPEEFRIDPSWSKAATAIGPTVLLAVLAAALLWMLVKGLLGTFDVMAEGPASAVAILVALATLVILVGLKLLQMRKMLAKIELQLDPWGLNFREGEILRSLAWSDIYRVGPVVPLRGLELKGGGSSARAGQAAAGLATRGVQAISGGTGLIGRGRIWTESGGGMAQTIIEQNAGVWGSDQDGTPLVAIDPTLFDRDWRATRIGAWVGHYRPDLLR